MKSVVFGQRRSVRKGREPVGSFDAALAPALAEGHWDVPGRFNFTRDVVEVLAEDPRRQALTFLGADGVIEPRTFLQLAQGASRWAAYLDEHGVRSGDRVLVVEAMSPDWAEIMLAGIKLGAVVVPCAPKLPAAALDIRIAASGAKVVVASRAAEVELVATTEPPTVLYIDEARRLAHRLPKTAPTHNTSARDPAFIVSTSGRTNGPRGVVHTHASTFAARVHTRHWLDAGLGDVVWCSARSDSAQALWSTLLGPWSRGAEVVLHEGALDPVERLELVHRLGVTVLCQTPAEYRELADSGHLARFRLARPRRLVSTGDCLSEELIGVFENEWGLTIHDGYGQAETGIVVGHDVSTGYRAGSIGRRLPGYDIGVIDASGNELPAGHEGDLALRGHPPSLFSRYWNAADETRAAFRGDWYVTGDIGVADDDGFFWLRGRSGDVIARPAAFSTPAVEILDEPEREVAVVEVPQAAAAAVADVRVPAPSSSGAETARPLEEEPLSKAPLWMRVAATIWLLLIGVLVGGAAIPHASDEPRVVPPGEDAPNAICLPPSPRP